MNQLFFDSAHTLRSGWRAAIFLVFYGLTAMALGTTLHMILLGAYLEAEPGTARYLVVNSVTYLIPAILIGWLCGKYLEGLPYSALGVSFKPGWFRHLIVGLGLGALTLTLSVLLGGISGGLRFELPDSQNAGAIAKSLVISFVVFAFAAAFEEAVVRGYFLQTFVRAELTWLAILLTSLVFGLGHSGNPDAGIISTVNTILAGVWFAVAYLKTKDLWFVWGLHLMWNWMQGSFFGIEVSGLTEITSNPLLREVDRGPAWLTGQTYGIEGGLICTAALVVSTVLIHFWKVKPHASVAESTTVNDAV